MAGMRGTLPARSTARASCASPPHRSLHFLIPSMLILLLHITKHGLAVPERNALGNVPRQLGKPASRETGVLRYVVPALRRGGIGSDHEAIGEFQENGAPVRVELAARRVIGAPGEIAPEVTMAAQHFAH